MAEGLIELRKRYEDVVIAAAENGDPPPPPFEEWVKSQQTLSDVLK